MERDEAQGAVGQATAATQNPDEPDGDYHQSSLWRWSGPASLIGGALFAVLGWMLVAGAIAQGSDEALANARPDELVQILDSLDAENDRLEQEKRRLAAEIASLTSGSDAAALEQARNRKESLEVLAGTTKVRGPGVRIVIRDPGRRGRRRGDPRHRAGAARRGCGEHRGGREARGRQHLVRQPAGPRHPGDPGLR